MLNRIVAYLRSPRRALLTAGAAVGLGGLVTAVSLTSCQPGVPAPEPAPVLAHHPLRLEDVPVVRVRLTAAPTRRVELETTGACDVFAGDRRVAQSDAALDPTPVTRQGETWHLGPIAVRGPHVELRPRHGARVRLDGTGYRGRLRLVPRGTDRLLAVNHVDMESYLAGVLPRELYPHWQLEAYRAQAVAARTFALYHAITAPPAADYDLGAGQGAQVYGGADAETDRSWQAVRQTHGLVLTVGAPGSERVFMAQYSSCCGGRVNAATAIRDAADIEPLRGGQHDEHCAACPRYRWGDVSVPRNQVHEALLSRWPDQARRLGGVRAVRVTRRGTGRWIAQVEIVGVSDEATMRIRGQDLRLVLLRHAPDAAKLYSVNCDIRTEGNDIVFADG
ncbi:MAG: SpoIID/LytB domain-containing protein, partial [Planctomycetota bacterium]